MTRTIRQIVDSRPFVTVSPDETVRMGCAILMTHQLNALAVVDGTELLGVFGEHDVVYRAVAGWRDVDLTQVRDVMDAAPVTIPVQAPLQSALELLLVHRLPSVAVVDQDQVLGMLTLGDMPYLAAQSPTRVRGQRPLARVAIQ